MSMRPISTRNFYMDIKRHGLSPLHFTLCEFVGMRRGSFPPLDFVTRIVSSKFWMLEADKWVDLLIICRWANPIIYTIKTKDVICWICGNEWVEPGNTSCGHTFCTDCLHGKFENGCMKCPLASCQAVVDDKVYPNESAKVLLIRYREERQTSEKRPSEYIPGKDLYTICSWCIYRVFNYIYSQGRQKEERSWFVSTLYQETMWYSNCLHNYFDDCSFCFSFCLWCCLWYCFSITKAEFRTRLQYNFWDSLPCSFKVVWDWSFLRYPLSRT